MNAKTMYGKCLRKRAYRTYAVALRECKKVSEKYNIQYYVYWCKLCGMYHLTKQPQNTKITLKNT